VEWDRGTNNRGTRRVENSERVANSKRVWIVAETPTISTVASETSEGHRKRYLIEAQSGSFRPSGLRIKRAEV
jgi:hypothetical protein